ncbi:MAG: putative cyclic di-GMP phosphodiesterase PdeK [Candidatus Erwinia impunctatus]|nr:putative cyclic di-GMP phosphodiesterase PdeK [Culicoides impunctatus]
MRVSRSLTIKQMVISVVVVMIFVAVFVVTQVFHFVQQRRVDYAQQMELMAHSLRQPLSLALFNTDINQAGEILDALKTSGIVATAEVQLPGGVQVLQRRYRVSKPVPALAANLLRLPVTITVPLYSLQPATPKPMALLVLQADSARIYTFILSTVATMVTAYLLLVLILSIALSWCINKLMIRPLRRLANELQALPPEAITSHQFVIPAGHANDELGMLVRSYNRNQRTVNLLRSSKLTVSQSDILYQQNEALSRNEMLTLLLSASLTLKLSPRIDLRDGHLAGAQVHLALPGLQGEQLLPDDRAIPAGEEMAPLWFWMVDSCCDRLAVWQKTQIGLALYLDIPPAVLASAGLLSHLQERLSVGDMAPSSLVLETDLQALSVSPDILKGLKQAGVTLMLNSDATENLSVTGLINATLPAAGQLKVDLTKINRSLTALQLLSELANKLVLALMVTHVDSAEDEALLRSHGVIYASGAYCGSPLSIPAFTERYFPDSSVGESAV